MDNQEGKVSESYQIDHIVSVMKKDKELVKIIEYARANPSVLIPFNPLSDEKCLEWFNEDPEKFPALVKASAYYYLTEMVSDPKVKDEAKKKMRVLITDANEIKMHQWGPEYEGRAVSMNALIIAASKPETYTKEARYVCVCSQSTIKTDTLSLKYVCYNEKCENYKQKLELDPASVKTGYYQKILIQEPLEDSESTRQVIFDAVIKDDDVKNAYIGQRVKLVIVFRSIAKKFGPTNSIVGNVISMQPLSDVQEQQPTEEQIAYFQKLKEKENYYNIITESIAPNIKNEFLAKFCVLLGLIGSKNEDGIRGLIHVFLVGDPAGGKSGILEYTLKLRKKSAMAVGGTMSGSGVTVTMDTLPNGTKMPKVGIVGLCKNGHVVLDEINQLDPEDLGKLYECMESMRIHYNKGGFDMNVDAPTTILAGANPQYYIYNPNHTIVDNINLPAPLLSRFGLTVNMQRSKKASLEKTDIYRHINLIGRIGVTAYIEKEGLLKPEELAAFLTYVQGFDPKFTDESDEMVIDWQTKIESLEQPEGAIPIDNRFYYDVKRISKAIARLEQSNVVTPAHVSRAIDTIKRTMMTFGMNVEAGEMQLKFNAEAHSKPNAFFAVCHGLEARNPDGRFSEDECIKAMLEQYKEFFPTVEHAEVFFVNMYNNGKIGKTAGRYKLA